jgi:hypothetical protein
VPVTFAENCCVWPVTTCAVCGETFTATGGRIVTVAESDLELSAFDTAVTVTCAGLGRAFGAV